jgi:hypothetical protein
MAHHKLDNDDYGRCDFGFTHRQMFRNRIPVNLQHVKCPVSESILTLARIAAEIKFIHIVALLEPLASAYPD